MKRNVGYMLSGLVDIDSLRFLGSYVSSPDRQISVAFGDRRNASNPSDKWIVVLRDQRIIHEFKVSMSVTDAMVTNSGLIFLGLHHRSRGTNALLCMRERGEVVFKRRGLFIPENLLIAEEAARVLMESDGELIVISLLDGKVTSTARLPEQAFRSMRLVGPQQVEIEMAFDVIRVDFQ